MAHSVSDIRPILANAREELLQKANVVATGIGYKRTNGRKTKKLAIICSVESKQGVGKLPAHDLIESDIDGIPTDVNPTGPISPFDNPRGRFRPAPGGVSIGHYQITAGTFGCLVKRNESHYILSNNHVLANSNLASIGDPILQPAPADGGSRPDDELAQLVDFIPIRFSGQNASEGCSPAGWVASLFNRASSLFGSVSRLQTLSQETVFNRVDCAIAEPNNRNEISDQILRIGEIKNLADGTLNMEIVKSGRTTGLTTGQIEQIDVTVRVNFGFNRTAMFEDQLMAGAMSDGGDSGSVVLDQNRNLVGLLFAGSTTTTIINRIQHVFSELEIELP